MSLRLLSREFYERDPEIVAMELLGNVLTRKLSGDLLEGIVVEAEAYYGFKDPASRAYHGLKKYNQLMWKEPGRTFIYNVHKYWMFNIVAHKSDEIGAVLIRALQPTRGIAVMRKNRPVEKVVELTNGPGKLTTALKIDKSLNAISVTISESKILIVKNKLDLEISSSHRIGVKKDLEKKLRFFIKGNKYVSR